MNKKLILIILMGMFLISLTSATLGTVEQGECIQLYQHCDDCTYINLTQVQYSDESIERINQPMERNDIDYNYTWCNTSNLGEYYYTVKGDKGGTISTERLSFEVTKTGQSFDFSSSLVSIGIIIGTIAIMFLFMIFGFKLTESEKLYPIGFLFIIFSVFFSVYLLHQSYVFSEVILGLESFSQTSGVIYVVVLWTLSGLAIITMALMLIAFIKELGKISDRKKFGDDFNPVEDSYNI